VAVEDQGEVNETEVKELRKSKGGLDDGGLKEVDTDREPYLGGKGVPSTKEMNDEMVTNSIPRFRCRTGEQLVGRTRKGP